MGYRLRFGTMSSDISSQECLLLYLPRVFPDVHETLRWLLNVFALYPN